MMSLAEKITPKLADEAHYEMATEKDAVELTYLFKDFFEESDYADKGISYSPNNAAIWLRRVISQGIFPHVVARIDGKIVGTASWSLDQSFSEEPIAVLHAIYVRPEFRRTQIGRQLMALALFVAEGDGATCFSAPISSGMKEVPSLKNMLRKAGFLPSGVIMTKGF